MKILGIFPLSLACLPLCLAWESDRYTCRYYKPNSWGIPEEAQSMPNIFDIDEMVEHNLDALFVPAYPDIYHTDQYFVGKILEIIPKIHTLYLAHPYNPDMKKKLKDACAISSCEFIDYTVKNERKTETIKKELKTVHAPVILVTGIGRETDKFLSSLRILNYLQNQSYRVLYIGSKNYCEVLGYHSFPDFMFSDALSDELKIFAFNHDLKKLEEENNPDVILLSVPGSYDNFNDVLTESFGLPVFDVCKAIKPDYVFMCLYYTQGSRNLIPKFNEMFLYKFGSCINAYHMSNVYIDLPTSISKKQMILKRTSRDKVKKQIGALEDEFLIFDMVTGEQEKLQKLYEDILNKIS